jgi:oxygen-independent coproporphyrinogen-3 oxidase
LGFVRVSHAVSGEVNCRTCRPLVTIDVVNGCRALYVHVPFCRAKCAYCDFNSYAGQERLIPRYVDALLLEATHWSQSGRVSRLDTVYFGGGTPSLLPADQMTRLVKGLRRRFDVTAGAEMSMEANPESVDLAHLRTLRELGVNRLSIGVQSFDDTELRFLGRIHDAARAEAAFLAAREAGFQNVSLDLIFGLPGQSLAQWQPTLEEAIALAPDHLSLYALTIEDGTPLAARIQRGECPEPDPDLQADIYVWSSERLAGAGYEQYEISNWSRPGRSCRHNLTYWRCEPYLGLGAGAHSYVDGYRFANIRNPRKYIDAVFAQEPSSEAAPAWTGSFEPPDFERDLSDALILGLRLNSGISLDAASQRFAVDVRKRYSDEIVKLEKLGLLELTDERMRLTDRGRLLGNEVFERFLP